MIFKNYILELRGVAITIVILYHMNIIFKGGYIGVDIFFVVSGFLISKIIHKDLCSNKFSYITFYSNRFKRILPSSFFILFCVYNVNCNNLDLLESINIFVDIIYATIFNANNRFYKQMFNYFNNSNNSPILNYWSLSIEEQFYFLLPIILNILLLLNVRCVIIILSVLIFSFINNIYYSYTKNNSYFLFNTRIWEVLCGCIIALSKLSEFRSNKFLYYMGLLLLLIVSVFFDNDIVYPGLYSSIPVILTMIIIIFNNNKDIYLSNFILLIGKLSYVLYLIHYPMLYYLSLQRKIMKIMIIILTSLLVNKTIEYPFHKVIFKRSKIFPLLYSITFILIMIYKCIKKIKNLKKKLLLDKSLYRLNLMLIYKTCNYCVMNNDYYINNNLYILFIGDSHVRQYIYSLEKILKQTSIDLVNIWITSSDIINSKWRNIISSYNIKKYFLYVIGFYYDEFNIRKEIFDLQFLYLIKYLTYNNIPILIINDNPSFLSSPIEYYIKTNKTLIESRMCIRTNKFPVYNGSMIKLVNYISLENLYYFNNSCKIIYNNIFMYSDNNHLSIPFLRSISKKIYIIIFNNMKLQYSKIVKRKKNNCSFFILNENVFEKIMKCKKNNMYIKYKILFN